MRENLFLFFLHRVVQMRAGYPNKQTNNNERKILSGRQIFYCLIPDQCKVELILSQIGTNPNFLDFN